MKTKNFPRSGTLLFSLFLLIMAYALPAHARVYMDITSTDFRKVKIAVPYFVDRKAGSASDGGRRMADLMSRALAFHGFIDIINPNVYNGSQSWNWPAVGAEFVVMGQYDLGASGITLELTLNDIHEGRQALSRSFSGPVSTHPDMIKKFCDEVVLQLTGEAGVSTSKIAFVSNATGNKEVYLADVLGEEIRQVTRHEYLSLYPKISPDGRYLAYTSYHRGNPNLYLTDLRVLQTTKAIAFHKGLNMAPSWAPDSNLMAVTISKGVNPDIYVIDNSGQEMRKLTNGEGVNTSASWSPDGKQLAFVSDRSGTPQVYLMDIATKAVRRLTYMGNENTTPAWSPKGDSIAYTGLLGGGRQIMLIKPEGGTPMQLTQSGGDNESPSWSADGRQIVFSRKVGGRQELAAIFKNGAGMRTLFNNFRGNQVTPAWSPRLEH